MKTTDHNSGALYFSINEVAKLLGVVPATIRNWEKQGFFVAHRGANSYRIYSLEDIETLRKIRKYSIDDRMGTKAIQSLMQNQGQPSAINQTHKRNSQPQLPSRKLIGHKWKAYRDKLNLKLEEVASQVGISTSYLSKIEKGKANISYEILERLATFYGESVLHFFDPQAENQVVVKKGTGEIVEAGLSGVSLESLISQRDHIIFPMLFTIEPGAGAPDTHSHHGEEFIYVLSGAFQVTLNHNEVYELNAGDTIFFRSNLPHDWKNPGHVVCQVLWVHSPIER